MTLNQFAIVTFSLFFFGCSHGPQTIAHKNVNTLETEDITSREGAPLTAHFFESQSMKTTSETEPHPSTRPESTSKAITLGFPVDKAQLSASHMEKIDQQIAGINPRSIDKPIEIIGYADPTGDYNYNLKLSHQRALEVKKYLVSQGFDAKQISAFGAGEIEAPTLSQSRVVKVGIKK